jgi:peptidoglycan/xylan/chitin deacetylase (PgdA/CDA1 family)
VAGPGTAPPVRRPLRSRILDGLCSVVYHSGLLWLGLRVRRFLGGGRPRILCYHRVARDGRPGTLHTDRFARHVAHLKANYEVVPASRLAGTGVHPGSAVAITFDDGYRCLLEEALPVLRSAGVSATFFVLSGHLPGRGALFLDRIRGTPLEAERKALASIAAVERDGRIGAGAGEESMALMDAADLRSLIDLGQEVGSHGRTHGLLPALPVDEVRAEVAGSREEIRKHAGIEATLFAYPWGAQSDGIRETVRSAGYAAAFTTEGGPVQVGVDPLAIPRVHVPGDASVARLACEAAGLVDFLRSRHR